jgi:zinc protease
VTGSLAPLRPLRLPPVYRERLANGLEVILVRHGASPLMSARLVIRAGSVCDPPGKEGLADLTAQLLRRGSLRRSAEALDEAVEFVGGSLSVGAAADWLSVRVSGPSVHARQLLDVLAEVIREPRFDGKEVEGARTRTAAELASDRDDAAAIADKAMARHLWGSHPYGNDGSGTPTSVGRLRREDVVAFHRALVGPRVSALCIVGQLDPVKALRLARRALGDWVAGPERAAPIAEPGACPGAGKVLLVDGPELTQSQVRLGWHTLGRADPDAIALRLVNHVLGGGFTSHLVKEARVRRGLTYGISSHFGWLGSAASHEIATSTRAAHTREIIDVSLAQVAGLRARGPSAAALLAAQRYMVGMYPSTVERGDSIATRLTEAWLFGLGGDWIDHYRERIVRVSHVEAVAVAKARLAPHPPAMVVVGNAEKIARRLSSLGPVRVQRLADFE